VAWVWDGHIEALAEGMAFESALKAVAELVESADEGSSIWTMLEVQALHSTLRQNLIDAASLPLAEALETLAGAATGNGWSTDGPLGGSGHTIYVSEPVELNQFTSECQAILETCAVKIQVATSTGPSLEAHRPETSMQWKFVASGFWYEDVYHTGHIAYYIANPAPGCWVMEARERNAILDDVTEEDVDEGRLNDDQIQAMWGQTLEEAQNAEYRHIVALSEGVSLGFTAAEMAAVLYRAVCKGGGNEINEPDDHNGLLEI
jgi:hypothetical protein